MSKEVLSVFEVNEIMGKSRPKTGWAYDLCRDIEAAVVSRFREQGGIAIDNINQAAANKAAEEGGLPYGYVYECVQPGTDGKGWCEFFGRDPVEPKSGVRNIKALYERASRQVANKAEVDLSSLSAQTGADIELVYSNRDEEFVRLDDVKAFLANPPATTGASTAPTDEELLSVMDPPRAALKSEDWDPVTKRPKVKPVGTSTVLTDERISEALDRARLNTDSHCESLPDEPSKEYSDAYFFRQIQREVAAQAGQVAVPDFEQRAKAVWDDALTEARAAVRELQNNLEAFGYSEETARVALDGALDAIDELRASPAKESK